MRIKQKDEVLLAVCNFVWRSNFVVTPWTVRKANTDFPAVQLPFLMYRQISHPQTVSSWDGTERRTVYNTWTAFEQFCWMFRSQQVQMRNSVSSAAVPKFSRHLFYFQKSSGNWRTHADKLANSKWKNFSCSVGKVQIKESLNWKDTQTDCSGVQCIFKAFTFTCNPWISDKSPLFLKIFETFRSLF